MSLLLNLIGGCDKLFELVLCDKLFELVFREKITSLACFLESGRGVATNSWLGGQVQIGTLFVL